MLLGFARSFADPLGVDGAPYEVSREYLDEFAYTNCHKLRRPRTPGDRPHRVVRGRIRHSDTRVPDGGGQAFSSGRDCQGLRVGRRIVELPFTDRPNEDIHEQSLTTAGYGIGLPIVIAAIVLATAQSARLGLFLLFFVLYFGGIPATQFDARHFFHLEFITWWAMGFLLQSAATQVRASMRRQRAWPTVPSLGFARGCRVGGMRRGARADAVGGTRLSAGGRPVAARQLPCGGT